MSCGNEPSDFVKCGEFIDYFRNCWLPKRDCAPWGGLGWVSCCFLGFYHYEMLKVSRLVFGSVFVTSDLRLFISIYGRAVAQAVNGWPDITETRFRFQLSPWKICDGHGSAGRGFSPIRFFTVRIIPPVVIFITTLLLPEGRMGDAWESSTEQCCFGNWGILGKKNTFTLFFSMRRDKMQGYMEVLHNRKSTCSN